MYIVPKPSRYWSLRYDSSASGDPATFSSNNQGLVTTQPLMIRQFGTNVTSTIPTTKYLSNVGYTKLRYYARIVASTQVGNTYTALTLSHEVDSIVTQFIPTIPDNLNQNWTVNFWLMTDWSPLPGLQTIFFNGGFFKLQGDPTHKPYFQYGLFLDKPSFGSQSRLRLIVFKRDGTIASNISFNIVIDDLVSTNNTWQNITITHNVIDSEFVLTMKSGDSIFGYTPTTYNYEASGQYNVTEVYMNMTQTVGIFNTSYGSVHNLVTSGVNNRVPHSFAKNYWPFGNNPSEYYRAVVNGVPIPLIYTPKDDAYETYAVARNIALCHMSVWLDSIQEPETLRNAYFPFQVAHFIDEVIVSNTVTPTFDTRINLADSILVGDSVQASSKFFNFVNSVAVTDSITLKAPFKFNIVTDVGTADIGYTPGIFKGPMLHNVKVTDIARPNIMSFDIVDGIKPTDSFEKRGTLRIDVVTSLAAGDTQVPKTPRALTVADTVFVTDTFKSTNSTFAFVTDVSVDDTIIKKGPTYITVVSGVTVRDSIKSPRVMGRSFVSCVSASNQVNPAESYSLDNGLTVGQATTVYKVYSFVSNLTVGQNVVPSDINYDNVCYDTIKAQVPVFTTDVAVSDAVGLVSGSAYAMGDSLTVGSSVVGFKLNTSGYSPFLGAI